MTTIIIRGSIDDCLRENSPEPANILAPVRPRPVVNNPRIVRLLSYFWETYPATVRSTREELEHFYRNRPDKLQTIRQIFDLYTELAKTRPEYRRDKVTPIEIGHLTMQSHVWVCPIVSDYMELGWYIQSLQTSDHSFGVFVPKDIDLDFLRQFQGLASEFHVWHY